MFEDCDDTEINTKYTIKICKNLKRGFKINIIDRIYFS